MPRYTQKFDSEKEVGNTIKSNETSSYAHQTVINTELLYETIIHQPILSQLLAQTHV